jgi:TP901 family phage tail tape measure protein
MAVRDVNVEIDIIANSSPLMLLNRQINNITRNARLMGNGSGAALDSVDRRARTASGGLNGLNDTLTRTNGRLGDVGAAADATTTSTLASGAGAVAVGGMFSKMGGLIVGAFQKASMVGMDFEAKMDMVGVITGATSKEMKRLNDTAIKLGADTPKSASEVADAMKELAAKGYDANKTIAAMPGIISASVASGEDLAMTSDVVTSALNAFNMKAKDSGHVADVMAMSANKTAAGVNDLGYAFKYAAPVANTLGIKMEELAASTGMMIDKGLTGESAGTSLRMGLMRLADAPKEASKAMDKMGFSAVDAKGKFKGIGQITDELRKKLSGMTQAQKVQTVGTIFGVEAATGWLNLIDSAPGKIQKMTGSLVNSNGASAKAAKDAGDNAKGALEQMMGSIEAFQIRIEKVFGEKLKGTFKLVGGAISSITNSFKNLSSGSQSAIVAFVAISGGLLAIAGAALVAWGGFMLLSAGLGLTAAGMWAIMWPVLAVIGAIALVVAIVVLLWQKFDWFRNGVLFVWNAIVAGTMIAFNAIKNAIMPGITAVVGYVKGKLAEMQLFWSQNGAAIVNYVKTSFTVMWTYIQMVMGIIKGIFQVVWPSIVAIFKIAWATIQIIINTAISLVMGIIRTGLAIIRGDWSGAWNSILGTIKEITGAIGDVLKNLDLEKMGKDMIHGLIKGILSMAGAVGSAVKSIWNTAKSFFGGGGSSASAGNTKGKAPKVLGGEMLPGHATGLYNVPYDNYAARLHKGESVLTAAQSNMLRSSGMLNSAGDKPSLNMDAPSYTPESSVTNTNSNSSRSIVLNNTINVAASGGSNSNIKQQAKEALDEFCDYFNEIYGSEVAY